jgi:hypothetical protein
MLLLLLIAAAAAAAAAGVVVMFAGAIMMHELLRQPLLNWILPLALILGLLLLGGIALEVLKAKVRAPEMGVFNWIIICFLVFLVVLGSTAVCCLACWLPS